ncbi:MAG: Hpt domain-containing protein, partial [Lautropia sp.]
RRLMARINIQARRTLEQLDPVADRLLKDLLFHLARAQDSSPIAAEVRRHYRLAGTVPSDFERVRYGLTDPALVRRANDALAALRKSWEKIVRGSLKETGVFAEAACELVDALRDLPHEGMQELAQALASLPKALESVSASDEMLAVEVATAILFSEAALDGGLRSDPAYDTRAGQLGRRLLEVMKRPAAFGESAPQWLVDISRKASERITLGAFVNELSANLASCEQALDGYFRDPSTVGQLAALKPVINQSTGVLKSLGYVEAAKAGAAVGADIDSLLDSDEPAAADDHPRIANNLSALGFFVESLLQPAGQGPVFRFDDVTREFLARGDDRRRATTRAPGRSSTGSLGRTGSQEAVGSAESRIAAERTALVPWLTLLAAAPQAPEVHDNLLRCLSALERDSVLIDDLELKRKAGEAIRQLRELGVGGASARSPSVSLDAVTGLLSDLAGEAMPVMDAHDPVDLDLNLDLDLDVVLDDGGGAGDSVASAAAEERVDDADPAAEDDRELLEIFLLEADEVLSAIAESLQQSRIDPTDTSALTTIRRAFHTLKGSSRMVGLMAFGDAGLAFEQVLNKWLADEQPGTAALFALIESGHERFSMWVARLHQDRFALMDFVALIARCEALRDGREAQEGQPDTETSAQASPVPTVDSIAHEEQVFCDTVAADISEPLMAQARESGFEAVADQPAEASAGEAVSDPMPEFSLEELEAFADTEDLPVGGDCLDPEAESPSRAPAKVWIGERSIDAQLFGIFNAEAADIRQRLDAGLADWRERRDLGAPEALLRAVHSLIGTSRHVGLLQLRAIAEPTEQFLLNHAKANRPLPSDHSVLLYSAIGSINSMLDQFSQCHEPPRDAQSERAMMDLAFQWSNPDSIAQPADTDPSDRGEALRKKAAQVLGAAKQAVEAQNDAHHGLFDELDPDLGPIFFEEADDLLAQIDRNLRKWRAHPADELAPGSLMRLLHTIKGSARMAGAMRFGQMVHEMETRVEEAIGLPEVPETLVDHLLAQYDQAYGAYEGLVLAADPAATA